MTREEAERKLEAHLEGLRERGAIPPAATYFQCGDLGICYVYWHAETWWFRWIDEELKVAPWLIV